MPIRFRCAYCNQLMGISKRKAGTVVRCPNCAGQVIVPNPAAEQPGTQQPAPALFEGSDFDKLFEGTTGASSASAPAAAPQPVGVSGHMAAAGFDVEPLPVSTGRGPGIFLTPGQLTILSVTVILLLGLAFLVGLLIGRS